MKNLKLHWWILIGMAIGAFLGSLVHWTYGPDAAVASSAYQAFDGLSRIFLKLLKMIVIPLVFFSLVTGMLGMGSLAHLGRMGVRTFGLYLVTTFLALLTGLTLVNVIRPGEGIQLAIPTDAVTKETPDSFWEVLVAMVPDNVVRAATDFDLL